MAKLTAALAGYGSVAHASEVLHLAPRSVRDLIYAGRLPSVRVGRLHFIRAADLEAERRRRLGLPVVRPHRQRAPAHPRPRLAISPELRAQRAAERNAAQVDYAQRHHHLHQPSLPFRVSAASTARVCATCRRELPIGAQVIEQLGADGQSMSELCTRCGRRALLAWADQRRLEAAQARRLATELGGMAGGESEMRVA